MGLPNTDLPISVTSSLLESRCRRIKVWISACLNRRCVMVGSLCRSYTRWRRAVSGLGGKETTAGIRPPDWQANHPIPAATTNINPINKRLLMVYKFVDPDYKLNQTSEIICCLV